MTLDLLFRNEHEYHIIKDSGLPTRLDIASMFEEENVIWCGTFGQARAYKVTISRVNKGKRSLYLS